MFDPFLVARQRMVATQIAARGISNPAVLAAMETVPRHGFVPPERQGEAYEDYPLPIGHGQTISQPYIVAYMAEALDLRPTDRVLEVGAGSGYAAAVLARLVQSVHAVELEPALAARAEGQLAELGITNVFVHCADGALGWPEAAPFDGILLSCATPRIPRALLDQLQTGGRLLLPLGEPHGFQHLVRLTRTANGWEKSRLLPVAFVPLRTAP